MTTSSSILEFVACLLILSAYATWAYADSIPDDFRQCIDGKISPQAPLPPSCYTPNNSAFSVVLQSRGLNLRYLMPSVRKPEVILMPTHESHVQAAVMCAKKLGIQLRVRSGGHDYDGVSYASEMEEPFVILDMAKLRMVAVDIEEKSAWVEAGATIVFTVGKTLEQGLTKIVDKWQHIADKINENLFIRVIFQNSKTQKGDKTVLGLFNALFLGGADELLKVMQHDFPELGLGKSEVSEISWIESVLYIAGYPSGTKPEVLLQGKPLFVNYFKAKSDFLREPIPQSGLAGLWKSYMEDENALMIWNPYGGVMSNIPESQIPFPHRNGTICMIQYVVTWQDGNTSETRHIEWIRKLHSYMASYVSKSPREAYVNYRDLDLGMNKDGNTGFIKASAWGNMYYKNNFDRLVKIKTKFDPCNFFRHEQSIPPLPVTDINVDIHGDMLEG
ncbi:hypothetical protein Cgig2_014775 [Carnegiea gigantea]|uniref:FAD-binding PCMH-type domain-containing protein n=1 Tax=Carnegiea gigantea TaxID=171969 RepID=A0A9Q1QSL6_9CARY|nr:hypothetical protein Cgig2_014775 [Carnegiea gigantea]